MQKVLLFFLIQVFLFPSISFGNELNIIGEKKVPGITMAISLIWEGESLNQANLDAIEELRKEFPDISFVQLMNIILSAWAMSREIKGN